VSCRPFEQGGKNFVRKNRLSRRKANMEGNEKLKMSEMEKNNSMNENTEEFDGSDNNFDEKTSLFAQHDFDSESESPASKTKTAEMDRSLYMTNTVS